jgi:hypothetical protein
MADVLETENMKSDLKPKRTREQRFEETGIIDDDYVIDEAIAAVRPDQIDEITYIAGYGDPAFIKCYNTNPDNPNGGINFHANVPVKVKGSQTIEQLLPIRTKVDGKWIDGIMQPDGTLQTRHITRRVPIVVLAKRNPSFSVNGAPPFPRRKGESRLPTDPDQYRGHATRWIMACTDTDTLKARWAAEAGLRRACGCSEGDEAFLLPFFEMKLAEVA